MTEAKKKAPAKKREPKGKAVAKPMSERKQQQMERQRARVRSLPIRPQAKLVRNDEGTGYVLSHGVDEDPDFFGAAVYDAVGSKSEGFMDRALGSMSKLYERSGGGLTAADYDAGLAIMSAVQPENEIETLFAVQMIAANEGALSCMARMKNAQFVDQLNTYGNLANKFMRTFNTQMETLAKIRRGGEQVIKYVHVHEGGQAVIGSTINQGGGGNEKGDVQPYGAGAASQCASLPGPDAARDGMPLPGHAEREMQTSRREESGGPEGQ